MSYRPSPLLDAKDIAGYLSRELQRIAQAIDDNASYTWTLTDFGTPTALAATTNNWAPPQLSTANILRMTTSGGARDLTGIKAPITPGRVLGLINYGANNITLKNQSASSAVGNRFFLSADRVLAANDGILLWYDPVAKCWMPLS